MARGLSPNQMEILAYLESKVDHDQASVLSRSTHLESMGLVFRQGIAAQSAIRKHFKESLGKVITDGNMSRLCAALHKRGLVQGGDGCIQLTEYVKVQTTYPVYVPHQMPVEVTRSVMAQATRKALDAGAFGVDRTVPARVYWRIVRTAIKAAHASYQSELYAYRTSSYSAPLSLQMASWKKSGQVESKRAYNTGRWGTRKHWVAGYSFGDHFGAV